MRLVGVAAALLLSGCGSVGLDPFADSGGGGDLSDALTIDPSGPISFNNVSPFADPVPTNTLTITNVFGDTVAINEIGLSDTSSRAFAVDVPDDIFPLRLQADETFDFEVYFPSETYQDRDQTGTFNGAVAVLFQAGKEGEEVELTKTVTGTLCSDYDQDGTCG